MNASRKEADALNDPAIAGKQVFSPKAKKRESPTVMSIPTFDARFYGPAEEAHITCFAGRCMLEVMVFDDPPAESLRCELLIQPADELGLPAGPPACLADFVLETRETSLPGRCAAFTGLPATIDERVARRCYLRVTRAG